MKGGREAQGEGARMDGRVGNKEGGRELAIGRAKRREEEEGSERRRGPEEEEGRSHPFC